MNYVWTHLHTDLSNGTTNIDSVTKATHYISKAKELGMKAIAFTEHGNVFGWVNKKRYCDEAGIKYIHGVEIYITESLDEKVRDNYHTCLYARNLDGVREINQLVSKAYNRQNNHFYYTPRITIDQFCNLSDNVIISTACLGGVLFKGNDAVKQRYLDYLVQNKHRCFLELQHHNVEVQKTYNKSIILLHKQTGIPLITGTDTHCLDDTHRQARDVLQKSKRIRFDDEEGWDLTCKSYEQLLKEYEKHDYIERDMVLQAVNNTNVLADMVETFELDRKPKYPKLYDDSEKVFKQKINEGVKWRGLNNLPNYKDYLDKIRYEFEVYKHNGAIDYMLLEEDYKSEMRRRGVQFGYSRGSCSGSEIAYVLGITEIDSIKHKLNFERFMNKERISLADIDTDWNSEDRKIVKEYLYNKKGLYCCEIITFNTIADKGAIRDVGRAFNMELSLVDEICKNLETHEAIYRQQYPELFKYVDILKGVVVSVGNHPAGLVVSPVPIDSWFGTFTTSTNDYPISQINMKEIDYLNFVKLDVLGLDNIGIINETCKLANIERLTPNNLTADDVNVWESIRDNTLGIFQWESDSASQYLKQLFSDSTIEKIKAKNPNFSYIDLFSIGNGAIRPAGESYRQQLSEGVFRDNGHYALNEFLSPTLGYLVFQEQIIEFLNKFCGYTMGEADIVRRAFSKGGGTEQYIPTIKAGFIKTMQEKYNVGQKEAEELIVSFLQVIMDASNYLFSLNHSDPYSWIGYICGYLRYYYPIEFLTTMFNMNKNNMEKTERIHEYCKSQSINIMPAKFRYSKGDYFFNKETNTIYKGIASVKYLNGEIGDMLYELRNGEYKTFLDLLPHISFLNSRQLNALIMIGYFSEFGKTWTLMQMLNIYQDYGKIKVFKTDNYMANVVKQFAQKVTAKQIKEIDNVALCKHLCSSLPQKDYEPNVLIENQFTLTGTVDYIDKSFDKKQCVVLTLDTKYTPTLMLYQICTGNFIQVRVATKFLNENQIKEFDMIRITNTKKQQRRKKVDGKWVPIDEYYYYVEYEKESV